MFPSTSSSLGSRLSNLEFSGDEGDRSSHLATLTFGQLWILALCVYVCVHAHAQVHMHVRVCGVKLPCLRGH